MATHTAGRAEHNSGHWPSVNTGRPVASNIKYKYLLRNHIFFKIYLQGKLSWSTHHEIGVINILEYNGFRHLNCAEATSDEVWWETNWAKDSSKTRIWCLISNPEMWSTINPIGIRLINLTGCSVTDWASQRDKAEEFQDHCFASPQHRQQCFVTGKSHVFHV